MTLLRRMAYYDELEGSCTYLVVSNHCDQEPGHVLLLLAVVMIMLAHADVRQGLSSIPRPDRGRWCGSCTV